MQDDIEAEMIRGPVIKGTIVIDGETKPFYIKMLSPAVHEDLRNQFYHEYNRFAPMPSFLTDKEHTAGDITITYGFYSDSEEFLNRRQAARIAWSTRQVKTDIGLLTTADLVKPTVSSTSTGKEVKQFGYGPKTGKPTKRFAKPGRLKLR